MKIPKLKIPKLKKHKLKSPKRKKRKKSKSKKKKYKLPKIPKLKLPKRPERVDGRLTRTKDYSALFYFLLGSVFIIIMLLINLRLI